MYSGVRRAGGPPGFILRRLYSLQGGAPINKPIQPLQQSLSHGLESIQALFRGRLAHRCMDTCEDV